MKPSAVDSPLRSVSGGRARPHRENGEKARDDGSTPDPCAGQRIVRRKVHNVLDAVIARLAVCGPGDEPRPVRHNGRAVRHKLATLSTCAAAYWLTAPP